MNLRLLPLFLVLAVGCEDVERDTSTDTDTDTECVVTEADGCPCGWSKARSSGVFFSFLTVDGVSQATNFEPDNTYDGVPASCVQDDRREGQWIFEVGGRAYGKLIFGAATNGSYSAGAPGSTISIELFGHTTPTVFSGDSFSNGQFDFQAGGNTVEGTLRGNAISNDGVGLQINTIAEGTL